MRNVLPGAAVATLLWWLVDVLFGVYVRRVPYSVVYGGLAAVIGLIIWMQLSAVIVSWAPLERGAGGERKKAVSSCVNTFSTWSVIPDTRRTSVP